jgi:hypothetical protein
MCERDSVSTWGKYIRVAVIYNFRAVSKFNPSHISDLYGSVYVQFRDCELSRRDVESTPRIDIKKTHNILEKQIIRKLLPDCFHFWVHLVFTEPDAFKSKS